MNLNGEKLVASAPFPARSAILRESQNSFQMPAVNCRLNRTLSDFILNDCHLIIIL